MLGPGVKDSPKGVVEGMRVKGQTLPPLRVRIVMKFMLMIRSWWPAREPVNKCALAWK